MTSTAVELPPIANNGDGNDEDNYMNAVMGRNTYPEDTNDPNNNNNTNNHPPTSSSENVEESKLSKPNVQSGIGGASANLVNSIVGAGIIGIPYALKQSGLIAGLLLLVIVAYLTDKSLRIIVGLASFHPKLKDHDVRSFEDLASYPFGKIGSNFILVNMYILAYGAMVAYLLIIKDTVPTILGVNGAVERFFIMLVTSATIMLPLSMQRDMASLAVTSVFSVLADVILVVFIAAFAPISDAVENAGGFGQVIRDNSINSTLFIGLGILSTAMACQHSAFIVSGSLANKTMKRWSTVTGFSIAISTFLCIILGVCGFLGFLQETEGNVLNNFNPDSFIANAARSLLAITMFFTYPMECFVARHVLVMLFHGGDMDGRDDPAHTGQDGFEAGGYFCMNRRQTWTLGIYLMTLLPAIIFNDLGPVLSITGSLGGSCLSYIAPGLVFLGMNGDAFLSLAYGYLGNRAYQTKDDQGVTESDLPVAGDSKQRISDGYESPISSTSKKPLWWFLGGFPIWCGIASHGKMSLESKTGTTNSVTYSNIESEIAPTSKEFCIAIFFITFGIISAVLGVTSNIWVQVVE